MGEQQGVGRRGTEQHSFGNDACTGEFNPEGHQCKTCGRRADLSPRLSGAKGDKRSEIFA